MKKRLSIIAAVVLAAMLTFALVGCSSESEESTSGGSSSEEETTANNNDENEATNEDENGDETKGTGAELLFVTGDDSGTYYEYGSVLAEYATDNANLRVRTLSSEGSKANIQALQDKDAELAFCQTDVATYAYDGTSMFEGDAFKDFSVVAALFPEQVQIVTCDESIKSVEDLKGKTVSVGAANSGVNFSALDILQAYDLDIDEDLDAVYQDFANSADSLKDGEIDAAFIVAGAPTTAITDLSESKDVYLVSMDDEHIADMVGISPYYISSTIKADTYTGQDEDVETVAVLAVILAADSVDDEDIYAFVESIFDGAEKQPESYDKYGELGLDTAASVTSIPYHPGAAEYYKDAGITVESK